MAMRMLILALAAMLGTLAGPVSAANIYVMRHLNTPAGQADPDLLAEGQAAAARLPALLAGDRPVAIFVTDYKRTRETAAPLAAALRLTPIVYDQADNAGLVARVHAAGGTVLIVGHSNTVPAIVQALGGTAPAPLGHNDFGDIWRIAPDGTTTHLRVPAP